MSTSLFDFESLFAWLREQGHSIWVDELQESCHLATDVRSHGRLAEWCECWQHLPDIDGSLQTCNDGRVAVSGRLSALAADRLRSDLMKLCPWRKGPFDVCGIHIDTEWRSDWKWNRLKTHVQLQDCSVLDVGCGNGYFGWQMLAAGATRVMGLDPFLLYVMQHEVIRKLATAGLQNYVLPLGDECLRKRLHVFDATVSMGVLYHRTSPVDHLQSLHGSLQRDGQLVLETLVLDTPGEQLLMPESRYAKMRNVWFIPTVELLKKWLRRTGFHDIQVVDVTRTTTAEQRSTEWMTFESLPDFLAADDVSKTVEGYPAPLRAMLTARRR